MSKKHKFKHGDLVAYSSFGRKGHGVLIETNCEGTKWSLACLGERGIWLSAWHYEENMVLLGRVTAATLRHYIDLSNKADMDG